MLALRPGVAGGVVAILTIVIGLAWMRASRSGSGRASAGENHRVELSREGFCLIEGSSKIALKWGEMASVDVDEDFLRVVVRQRSGDSIVVEPRYGSRSVYDLAKTIEDARRQNIASHESGT